MKLLANYSTSVGIRKNVNQDALCIKKAQVADGEILLGVINDLQMLNIF